MKKKFFVIIASVLISVFLFSETFSQSSFRIITIGDFGSNTSNEKEVSDLVHSLHPDIIIGLGDNIYDGTRFGGYNTYDSTVIKYYGDYYVYNDTVNNRILLVIGNHDLDEVDNPSNCYACNFISFFKQGNNFRYFTRQQDNNIKFVFINSDYGGNASYCPTSTKLFEPDGIDSSSTQGQWAKSQLQNSTARWNIVSMHYPPYNSYTNNDTTITISCNGSPYTLSIHLDTLTQKLRWPYRKWGADVVFTGHQHYYERLIVDGFTYLINGLGGKSKTVFSNRRSGSQFHYDAKFGCEVIDMDGNADSLTYKFITIDNDTIDSFVQYSKKSMRIKAYIQGLYNSSSGQSIQDTMKIILRNSTSPYAKVDSCQRRFTTLGEAVYYFKNSSYTNYYLVIKHRNSVETWSANPITIKDSIINYNFTIDADQAYGSNQIEVGSGVYVLYSGDVNQDGIVDASDTQLIENDANNFISGYVPTDLNGDNFVDSSDLLIVDNNSSNFISIIKP